MVEAARGGEHLRKPDAFLEMLEAYFPTLPKIEFNARRVRSGMLLIISPPSMQARHGLTSVHCQLHS